MGERNQCYYTDKILRPKDAFRHDVFDRPKVRPVTRRVTHRSLSPRRRASRPFCFDGIDAGSAFLPTDFHPITPAKPKHPPANNIQSGLSRVAKTSTADAAATSAAAQVRSEGSAKIRPLAPINPIESGTGATRIMPGQPQSLERHKRW